MKKSELSFADGFLGKRTGEKRYIMMAFDWNKAAEIIKEKLIEYPNLVASAGLQKDWAYTGGEIFENGKPTNEPYTFLCSNWAVPTLIIEVDGEEILEVECYTQEGKYSNDSKWDDESLKILGISL